MMSNKLLLVSESTVVKNSGIGRVARLMAQVLSDLGDERTQELSGISLNDADKGQMDWPWLVPCNASRMRFAYLCQAEGISSDRIFYDSLSMARAHFVGPARWRPSLAWMHGIEVWEGARAEHLRAASRVTLLVTNSEFTRNRAAELHKGLKRARVCWLGTETDTLPPRAESQDPPSVLILSRIDKGSYKGHYELINAWPRVVAAIPSARLLIAGGGEGLEEVRTTAMRSPVAGNIDMLGYVPEDELSRLWSSSHVFAMPSRGEGFGLTYIEAMRHGIPVVASRQDAGQEVNVDGETGFNVDLDRPRQLADALIVLLSDPARARSIGAAGQKRWQQHFTYSAFKQRFLALLHDEGLLIRSQSS